MTLHAGNPTGLGSASTHHAGNFFGQTAGAWGIGIGIVEMIKCGLTASDALGGGKACFMGGIIFGQ